MNQGLDPKAPVRADATVTIAAPPEAVWEVLAAAADWETWYPDLRQVEAAAPLSEGVRFSYRTGPVAIDATVDVAEAPRLLRFTGTARGSRSTYEFRLAAVPEGTEVTAAQTMSGTTAKLMRPMLQKIATRSLPEWLEALRRRAEGR